MRQTFGFLFWHLLIIVAFALTDVNYVITDTINESRSLENFVNTTDNNDEQVSDPRLTQILTDAELSCDALCSREYCFFGKCLNVPVVDIVNQIQQLQHEAAQYDHKKSKRRVTRSPKICPIRCGFVYCIFNWCYKEFPR
uniref:IlGF domain-containing protein n=1 Tax=Panagrellus redivivus TaxID=6233 RepID=A0A7E4WB77_PANRE